MILEIDAGNTRIKWRCWQGDEIAGYGVMLTENLAELGADIEAVGPPIRIRLSSVAGKDVVQVVSALAEKWNSSLVLAKTTAEVGGVHCGYHEPSEMGIDRWLAVVAAYQQVKGACVVVDAGSAITVDVIGVQGQHLGGYIVPGFGLMRASLFHGTSDVKIEADSSTGTAPGKTTLEAVNHGLLLMVEGLVAQAIRELAEYSTPQIILTGGDAQYLQTALAGQIQFSHDLVMDGLALVAP